MGSNSPGMPQSCHRPWLAGASSSMKSNWLCSTMTAASSRDLETYSRLLGAVLKVWSFKATISYNKFSLLTDSKLSMYLFSTEGRWTCCLPVIRKIRWITIHYIMPGLSDLDSFACLNILMSLNHLTSHQRLVRVATGLGWAAIKSPILWGLFSRSIAPTD